MSTGAKLTPLVACPKCGGQAIDVNVIAKEYARIQVEAAVREAIERCARVFDESAAYNKSQSGGDEYSGWAALARQDQESAARIRALLAQWETPCGLTLSVPATLEERAKARCPRCGYPDCTCGSGAHPRRCLLHPGAYDAHRKRLNEEAAVEERIETLTRELAEARANCLRSDMAKAKSIAANYEDVALIDRCMATVREASAAALARLGKPGETASWLGALGADIHNRLEAMEGQQVSAQAEVPSANLHCISWGQLGQPGAPDSLVHMDCAVVVVDEEQARRQAVRVPGPYPKVCPCDCQTCKRAWWADGRPMVRDGVLVRSAK